MVCTLGTTDCAAAPGVPFLPRTVVRPSLNLRLARDPFDAGRVLLAWDARQADNVAKDVYATFGTMR